MLPAFADLLFPFHNSRHSIWLPFVRDELAADEHSILIGHSSGAVACARYAEKYKVKGICVCAGYDDDLGDATERASGYFDTPWDYRKIQENTQFRVCFAGAELGATRADHASMSARSRAEASATRTSSSGPAATRTRAPRTSRIGATPAVSYTHLTLPTKA